VSGAWGNGKDTARRTSCPEDWRGEWVGASVEKKILSPNREE